MVRHSHEDAIDEASYDALVATTEELEPPFDEECLVVLVLAGRLGLRAGEIAHLRAEWVDTEREVIEIPRHSDCRSGKAGSICGYCHKRAASAVEHHDDLTMQEALEERWEPKTANSARAVPYDFDAGVAAVVEAFVGDYDAWPTARIGVNRRVDRVAEAAGYDERIYPHCLRATAAEYHASEGLTTNPLKSFMGWSQLEVAKKYIRLSGRQTSKALNKAHAND